MKTVQSIDVVEIEVDKTELLRNEWLNFQLLSKKLGDIEKAKEMPYKHLRNKFYNSRACNKYNMIDIAGIPCINVKDPMTGKASLILTFKVRG